MTATAVITGIGMVTPYGNTLHEFASALKQRRRAFVPVPNLQQGGYRHKYAALVRQYDPKEYLGSKGLRTLDRLTLHVMTAVELLHRELGFENIDTRRQQYEDEHVSIVLGTTGPVQSVVDYDLDTVRDPRFVQPGTFPNSVFNAAASYAAIRHAIRASCITVTNGLTSSLDAFEIALDQLSSARSHLVMVGGAEEMTLSYALGTQLITTHLRQKNPLLGEGSVFFSVERQDTAHRRKQPCLAEVLGVSSVFCPDVELAYEENIRRLCQQVEEDWMQNLAGIYQFGNSLPRRRIGIDHVDLNKRMYPQLGYLGSLSGAMAIATLLLSDEVPAGALLLLNGFEHEGHSTSLLLRKGITCH